MKVKNRLEAFRSTKQCKDTLIYYDYLVLSLPTLILPLRFVPQVFGPKVPFPQVHLSKSIFEPKSP